jgi:hypothetical protein
LLGALDGPAAAVDESAVGVASGEYPEHVDGGVPVEAGL